VFGVGFLERIISTERINASSESGVMLLSSSAIGIDPAQVGPVKKLNDRFANSMIGAQYRPNTIVAHASTVISP
jgi:hypothetical protein